MSEPADGERPASQGPGGAEPPIDASRRQFFRRFAGEVLVTAAQVTAVVGDLRTRSAREASALLGEPGALGGPGDAARTGHPNAVPADAGAAAATTGPTGFRTPFRFQSDDVLLVIDQRRLPEALVEVPVRSAPEAANAIRSLAVTGAPAVAQVAALALALSARVLETSRAPVRRAALENAAVILKNSRPATIALARAVDRLMRRYRDIGALSEDGPGIAAAMLDEAMTIVAETTDEHGRIAEAGLAVLPTPEDRPVRILTLGSTGMLAGGQFAAALGIVHAAHARERPLQVFVAETRPTLSGARLAAWELRQAGIPTVVLADLAAGPLLAEGSVDLVLVGADRIAGDGAVLADLGTYTLAVLADRHRVPLVVAAPSGAIDLEAAGAVDLPLEERPMTELTTVAGTRVAPEGATVRNPAFDVTPPELVTAIVTDEGVVRPPFAPGLVGVAERRAARRSGLPAT